MMQKGLVLSVPSHLCVNMLTVRPMRWIKTLRPLQPLWFIGLTLVTGVGLITSQAATCAPIVREALRNLDQVCSTIGLNMACYGHDKVYTTFRDEAAPETDFSEPSDLAVLHHLQSIQTAKMDLPSQLWGIAVLKIQADIPDTLPGQGVIFIMLGDVTVEDDAEDADRQNSAMQAFRFTSGMGAAQCTDAPSTLVVQGPNAITVNIKANGVNIAINSTLMLTQTDETHRRLTTLSGEVKATSPDGDVVFLPQGYSVAFEVDEEGQMVGTFDFPQPISAYDAELSDIVSETNPALLHYPIPGHGTNPNLWPEAKGSIDDGGSARGGEMNSAPRAGQNRSTDKDSGKRTNKKSQGKGSGKGGDDDD